MAVMRCELLDVEGVKNVRDVGGYPLPDGRLLHKRRFIRAGSLSNLTQAGMGAVRGLGVDCVMDLRSSNELRLMPYHLPEDGAIAYHHIPMLDQIQSNISQNVVSFPRSMTEMYCGLLDSDQHKFKKIFTVFADVRYRTVLYHCTAGKDRTGVTTMLLLQLCGLDDDSIVEDYSWSRQLLEPLEMKLADIPQYVLDSHPETMRETLDHLYQVYGSAEGYLKKIGVTEEQRQIIRAKMLA